MSSHIWPAEQNTLTQLNSDKLSANKHSSMDLKKHAHSGVLKMLLFGSVRNIGQPTHLDS